MATIVRIGVGLAVLFCVTGCGITGTWRVDSVQPSSARLKFPVKAMTLRDDGTATLKYGSRGEDETTDGKYEFDNGQLKVTTPALGRMISNDVLLTDADLGLRVIFESDPEPFMVTFLRVK